MGGKKLVLNLFVSFIYLTLPYSWSSTYLFIYVWYLSIFPFLSIYPYLSSYLSIFLFLSILSSYIYLPIYLLYLSISPKSKNPCICFSWCWICFDPGLRNTRQGKKLLFCGDTLNSPEDLERWGTRLQLWPATVRGSSEWDYEGKGCLLRCFPHLSI